MSQKKKKNTRFFAWSHGELEKIVSGLYFLMN